MPFPILLGPHPTPMKAIDEYVIRCGEGVDTTIPHMLVEPLSGDDPRAYRFAVDARCTVAWKERKPVKE